MKKNHENLYPYQLSAALYGASMAGQKMLNSRLSKTYGQWGSTIIVHLAGLLLLLPLVLAGKIKKQASSPWHYYLGGVIGVLNVVFSNIAVISLGITQSLVYVLVGQIVFSAILDGLGLFGVEKQKFGKKLMITLMIMLLGCFMMMIISKEKLELTKGLAILCSLINGGTLVVSRGYNRLLSVRSGKDYSTLMNFVTGLVASVAVFAITGFKLNTPLFAPQLKWIFYCGGFFGCIGIFFCNTAAVKISALDLSVLLFVGQSITGVLIDSFTHTFTLSTFVGALIVFGGFLYNLKAE